MQCTFCGDTGHDALSCHVLNDVKLTKGPIQAALMLGEPTGPPPTRRSLDEM